MKLIILPLSCLLAFGGSLSTLQAQTAPRLLPFQGRLTDQNGVAVSNGVRLVQFKIFDVPLGGSAVWAGELHRTTVNGGLVNVVLGSKTPFTGTDFDRQLYLEISVDINGDNAITAADPPMLPRQAILPVVFAKEAADTRKLAGFDWGALLTSTNAATGKLDGSRIADYSIGSGKIADGQVNTRILGNGAVTAQKLAADAGVPVGGVIMWWGSRFALPPGFEICDGALPTTTGALLQTRKPDLLDRFPKGAPSNQTNAATAPVAGGNHSIAATDTGGTALTVAQLPAHSHSVSDPGHRHAIRWGGSDANYSVLYIGSEGSRQGTQDSEVAYTGISIGNTGLGQAHIHSVPGHDNRPAFLELFFIIRVK